MIVSLVNCGTSIFAGFVIYAILGYRQHVGIGTVEKVGHNIVLTFLIAFSILNCMLTQEQHLVSLRAKVQH